MLKSDQSRCTRNVSLQYDDKSLSEFVSFKLFFRIKRYWLDLNGDTGSPRDKLQDVLQEEILSIYIHFFK
jgi:hypothetical protein